MNAPSKPWEAASRTGLLNRAQVEYNKMNNNSFNGGRLGLNGNQPQILNPVQSQLTGNPGRSTMLPALPPRPSNLVANRINPYANRPYGLAATNMLGGYSSYGPQPGGMFGGYPGSGYGYVPYNNYTNAPFDNRFLQAAEESSQNAFQSVESLVRAFTSVSMMLESTYQAMYSSFRAVLGVVDNFYRLRQMFINFLSAITLLRMIKNFYYRLLYWLGVTEQYPHPNQIWNSVAAEEHANMSTNSSSWPIFTFLGLLIGGPYLISKFLTNKEESGLGANDECMAYRCEYSFDASSDSELSFQQNEIIFVFSDKGQSHAGSGWLLAKNRQGKSGFVPMVRVGNKKVHFVKKTNDKVTAGQDQATAVPFNQSNVPDNSGSLVVSQQSYPQEFSQNINQPKVSFDGDGVNLSSDNINIPQDGAKLNVSHDGDK